MGDVSDPKQNHTSEREQNLKTENNRLTSFDKYVNATGLAELADKEDPLKIKLP